MCFCKRINHSETANPSKEHQEDEHTHGSYAQSRCNPQGKPHSRNRRTSLKHSPHHRNTVKLCQQHGAAHKQADIAKKYRNRTAQQLSSMRRPNTRSSFSRVIEARTHNSRVAMVVVFMPPAVEPDEPPISIKIIISILLAWLIIFKSMVLNPAVRADMDWKNEMPASDCPRPVLAAPLHSGQIEKSETTQRSSAESS